VLAEPGMPAWSTWWRWVVERPEVAAAWETAKVNMAHALVAEAIDVARKTLAKEYAARDAAIFLNMAQWVAGKFAPKLYSERHQNIAGVQVVINSTLALGGEPAQSQGESRGYVVVAHPAQGRDGDEAGQGGGTPRQVPSGGRGRIRGSHRASRGRPRTSR